MHSCTQILHPLLMFTLLVHPSASLVSYPCFTDRHFRLKLKGTHFIYSFKYLTEKIKMRITHLPSIKDCISAEPVYPFYTAVLMLDYIF